MIAKSGQFRPMDEVFEAVASPVATELGHRLASVSGLTPADVDVLVGGAKLSLVSSIRSKLTRMLLLELHAARLGGLLSSTTSTQRWDEFVRWASTADFWRHAYATYPRLRPRLWVLIQNRVDAVEELAGRLAADRDALRVFVGNRSLTSVEMHRGDCHRGGRSVARLVFGDRSVMYKPRSLAVDQALADFLASLSGVGLDTAMEVPRILSREDYGWSEYVQHRFCADEGEQRRFYTGLGQWAAVMAFLDGSDMHSENVMAVGGTAVVIDCETLFGVGLARTNDVVDTAVRRALRLVRTSVYSTGFFPERFTVHPERGAQDNSAAGALPGQQPPMPHAVIQDAGTDMARLAIEDVEPAPGRNLPVPEPRPEDFWEDLVWGFRDCARHIDEMDSSGTLEEAVARFADCEMRLVPRSTSFYGEFERVLWHPSSLVDEWRAIEEVREHLRPADRGYAHPALTAEAVEAEVHALLRGDIPVYTFHPSSGRLRDPDGVIRNSIGSRSQSAVTRWRERDVAFDERVMRMSLMLAYSPRRSFDDHSSAEERSFDEMGVLSGLVASLCAAAVSGEDGSTAFIGPVRVPGGNGIGVLPHNLYQGHSGVLVALAAYSSAMEEGRVPLVEGVRDVVDGLVRTISAGVAATPPAVLGGFDGIGGLVWTWLTLDQLGTSPDAMTHARRAAELIPGCVESDIKFDVISGGAGAVVPLLGLARRTGDGGYLDLARSIAAHLESHASISDGCAKWSTAWQPSGMGGFAHGSTGIGWALSRLALDTGEDRWRVLADQAHAFQRSLFDAAGRGWRDLRHSRAVPHDSWCHGSVGIGLSAHDLVERGAGGLHRDDVVRAASVTAMVAESRDQSLCHGVLGRWEQCRRDALDDKTSLAWLLDCLSKRSARLGAPRGVTLPALMNGHSGLIYQLLRASVATQLPSVLLQEVAPHSVTGRGKDTLR